MTYANAKLEKLDDEPVAVGSGGTNRRSRPRFFHLGTNEVNRNNRTIRNNPVSMQSIESDEDAMDLAMMLHELEMAGYATSDFMGVESEPPTQSNVSRNSPAIIASKRCYC